MVVSGRGLFGVCPHWETFFVSQGENKAFSLAFGGDSFGHERVGCESSENGSIQKFNNHKQIAFVIEIGVKIGSVEGGEPVEQFSGEGWDYKESFEFRAQEFMFAEGSVCKYF